MKKGFPALLFCLAALHLSCDPSKEEVQLQSFFKEHLKKVKPLMMESNLAYWRAATTGEIEAFDRYAENELLLRQIYSDPNDFSHLKNWKDSGQISDARLYRQLEVVYYAFLENQMEPELLKKIIDQSSRLEQKFSTFRGTMDRRRVSSNEVDEILKHERDSQKRKSAWLASKQVGAEVADDIIELVKLRNQAARNLGFDHYHQLSLTTGEQSAEELDGIFDELYALSDEPFAEMKAELDIALAAGYGVPIDKLMPWHYHDPFFQEGPQIDEIDLDQFYMDKDVKGLAASFFSGIGLPVDGILAHSDLYEREGKNPHAFCTDIDREGDVRILCNLKNNERWMDTILHELGHAVYDKYHDTNTPFLLRQPAHPFTTEAIAMFFGRLSQDPVWMEKMLGLTAIERDEIAGVSSKYSRLKQLVFARWAMVMYEFEKQLYADPDQDLNSLWWDIVGRYQHVRKPEGHNQPDWAAKIHFTIAPCYYHNYLLGELLASQLHYYIRQHIAGGDSRYIDQKKIGEYFKSKVFSVGAQLHWNEMIKMATGEPLTAKYFVRQFVTSSD